MPYIMIRSQDFPVEKKREMVKQITDAIMKSEKLSERERGFLHCALSPLEEKTLPLEARFLATLDIRTISSKFTKEISMKKRRKP